MMLRILLPLVTAALLSNAPNSSLAQTSLEARPDAREMAGLWEAKLRFGPDLRGPLLIERLPSPPTASGAGGAAASGGWRAEVAGREAEVQSAGDTLSFELPDGRGGFRGRFVAKRQSIVGHFQHENRYASPLTLTRMGKAEQWRGEVEPKDEEMTMYLRVEPRADGRMRAFIKNPERNAGYFMRVSTLERSGKTVRLLGEPRNGKPAEVLSEGVYADGVLSLPLRGGTYDLRRVAPGAASDFYPRSRPGVGASYRYESPPALDDGWAVATPEEVGLSRDALERLVRWIVDMPIDSVSVPDIHAVLIARHGKLVLEEYFHGENRDKPHDTRSASKSAASVLFGAMVQAGVPLTPQSRVYEVLNGGALPAELDRRKAKITAEHLLTMSSGLDANDSDDNSVGHEDRIQESGERNWWKITYDLKMVREPGEKAVYASMQPNLLGAVMREAAGRRLTEAFHELVAEPLQIRRYWLNLQPLGDPYMGGGMRFLPRDFMKLGQLILGGGTWNGRRVVSAEWAKKSITPLQQMGSNQYGYLWWIREYPYQGRTIQAFYAGGNGGQVVMGIPELDLLVATYGGNYVDPVMFQIQRKLVPEYVIPAVAAR